MGRLLVVTAITLSLAPLGAIAQPLRRPPPPLGPFAISMTTEDARAAVPGAEWQIVDDDVLQRGSMRTTGPATELHGVPFRVMLTYGANAVSLVRLNAELPLAQVECAARHRALVVAEARTRDRMGMGPYWHRFYEDPDGPTGRMENGAFVPAASFDARGVYQAISARDALKPVGFGIYSAPDYGQTFYSAADWGTEITAASFSRAGVPICELAMQISWGNFSGGFMVNNGPSGPERLAERLAAAEFVRPLTYLLTPDPTNAPRHFPSRAMHDRVEGEATMNCLVLADGQIDCAVGQETPAGYEFGDAASRIVRGYRANVFEGDVAGKRTEFTIRFRLPS